MQRGQDTLGEAPSPLLARRSYLTSVSQNDISRPARGEWQDNNSASGLRFISRVGLVRDTDGHMAFRGRILIFLNDIPRHATSQSPRHQSHRPIQNRSLRPRTR